MAEEHNKKENVEEQGREGEAEEATDAEASTEAEEATDAEAGTEAEEATDAEAGTEAEEATNAEGGPEAGEVTDVEEATEAEDATDVETATEAEEVTDAEATEEGTDTEVVSEGEGETWQETMDEGDTAEEEQAKPSEGGDSELEVAETESEIVPPDSGDSSENPVDTMVGDILGGQTSEDSATSEKSDLVHTPTIEPELGFSPLDRRLSEILRSLPEYRVFYQPSQMSVTSAGSLVSVPSEPLAMGHYPSGGMPRLAGGPQLLMPGMLSEAEDEELAEPDEKQKAREEMDKSWSQIQVEWSNAKGLFLDELEAYGEMVHNALQIVETHRNKEIEG